MPSAEVWVLNLLGAVSYVAGAYIAVRYVLPLVKDLLGDVVKYGKGVNAFVKLLKVAVYLFAASGIIGRVAAIGATLTSYISLAGPAIEVLNNLFFPTLRMLVIGIGILLVIERIKLK